MSSGAEKAGDVQDDDRQHDRDSDSRQHGYLPARSARGRRSSGSFIGFIGGVRVGGRVCHGDVLSGGGRGVTGLPRVLSRQVVSVKSECIANDIVYAYPVPRLWTETIEEHRRAVHDATLDTTAALVHEHGLAVTMSKIAAETGIGRATLYKYFPDVEAILVAWHERQIGRHLLQLAEARDQAGSPGQRLEAVLTMYALIQHEHHDTELAALLHRGEHIAQARRQLQDLVSDLLAAAVEVGTVRSDIAPDELASYCLSALAAAGSLPSEGAVAAALDEAGDYQLADQ